MSDFKLLLLICGGIYASECFVWIPSGGVLFLSWAKRFTLARGPSIRFKNPWPSGFSYRFNPSVPFPGTPSLNSHEIKTRWQNFQANTSVLLWLSRGLLMVCAGAIFLYTIRRGFYQAWAVLFGAFLSLHISIGILFWNKFGKLFPADKPRKIKKTILCALSPFQSMRSVDLLEEILLEPFHPLAVGNLLLSEEDFSGFCRRWLLEIRYPAGVPQPAETSPLLLSSSRGEEERILDHWISKQGLKTSKILAPPQPSHPSNLSFCRRCETEYQIEKGRCHDCGRDLVTF